MTRFPERGARILVGASSFVDARAALGILRRLIDTWHPSLGGILVEDTASLAICALPNQRIVTPSGTLALAPSVAQIRTLIEADARAFKKSLAELAELAAGAEASWTFERDRGDLVETSLHVATTWDILVFAHRHFHPVAGKIVLLEQAGADDSPLPGIARLLAAQLGVGSVILSVNGTGGGDASDAPPGSHKLDTLDDALVRLAAMNSQAVLVDLSRGPVHSAEDLRRLIDAARCPVFVFGTVSASRLLAHTTQIPPAPRGGNRAGD